MWTDDYGGYRWCITCCERSWPCCLSCTASSELTAWFEGKLFWCFVFISLRRWWIVFLFETAAVSVGGWIGREDGTQDWILETNRVSCICITYMFFFLCHRLVLNCLEVENYFSISIMGKMVKGIPNTNMSSMFPWELPIRFSLNVWSEVNWVPQTQSAVDLFLFFISWQTLLMPGCAFATKTQSE